MDICKCIVPSWYGGILNGRRAASPLVRLVEWEEKLEDPDHSKGGEKGGETKPIHTVTYSWDSHLAVPNDPRYARLKTNLGIGQVKEE
ncbi:hypothetical protein TNCV_1370411 [Trichonephila clavipes]|nr:hypothetical protein TNCV_1370411 [Trichonephila clavipes]